MASVVYFFSVLVGCVAPFKEICLVEPNLKLSCHPGTLGRLLASAVLSVVFSQGMVPNREQGLGKSSKSGNLALGVCLNGAPQGHGLPWGMEKGLFPFSHQPRVQNISKKRRRRIPIPRPKGGIEPLCR